ncbi:MAG: NAD-dependent epimerase/dehydratase family protein [Bradymonadales bacterium]|nr:NAD-dependent epimerase/dehydratase family protein [Bradymonadales bacterium]
MIANKRILLTGGAGFIGTALTRRLLPENEVVVLDLLRRNALAEAGLDRAKGVTLLKGDVREKAVVEQAMEGCHHVVHLASIAGVDTVITNPVLTMQVSLVGSMNVLEAATRVPTIERVIDFSTSEVFGRYAYNVTEGDVTSLGAVGEARWTYAVSKLATEHLAFNYHKQLSLPTCCIRPFNIYGPGQIGEGAIHHFVERALANEPLVIHNDGSQIRSWCYIDDIVSGVLLALARPEAVGHTFNLGNPRSTVTIHNLAQQIVRLSSSSSPITYQKWDYPDVELRLPNIDKARALLGFEPKVDLEEGLLRTIHWYRHRRLEPTRP